MNIKHIKTLVICSLGISIILVVALTNTSLSYAATASPFVGQWFAVDDFDGSDIRLTIAGKNNGPFSITWTESYFSGCGGEAGIVRGKGSLIESNVMIANLTLVCFKYNNAIQFTVQWVYDGGTDTLTSDFTTWHRANGGSKPCITPPSGVSGWWPADGNASDLIFGRNGVFNGEATTTSGLVDLSFRLDGDGDFISVPNDPGLNFGPGDFTIDLWVNFTDTSGEQVLIEKWIQGNEPLTTNGWTLTKLNPETNFHFLRLAIANGQGVELSLDSGDLDIHPGIWYHFAATRQDHTITLYMNGELVASQEMDAINLNSTSSLKFGHRGNPEDTPGSTDDRGFYLNGRIDEVEIFNGTALTVEQVKAIYSAGSAGKCKDAIITPQMFNLRVNYGHDWVESFYEAGHIIKIMVTEADGNTVKATAELITEPKDFWGGESGFQTRPEDWVPGPPDIRPYDWVFGWVDNGASAQLQLGEINGSVDIEKDEVTGNINAPWILPEEVNVECHSWGAGLPQEIVLYDWVLPDDEDVYTCSWAGEWDIQPGQVVGVSYFDQYGNWVVNALYPPWIRAHPEWNNVDAWFWPENKMLQLTIDDPATGQNPDLAMEMPGDVDPNLGSVWFELDGYDLKPGDIITMTDEVITKVVTVSNLTIDTVDLDEDIVRGTADSGDIVRLPIPGVIYSTADENGNWIAEFASAGFDVQPQTTMIAEEYDDDADLTSVDVWISDAYFDVRPNDNSIGTWNWPVGELTLKIYTSGVEEEPADFTTTGIVEGPPPGDPRNFLNFPLNTIFDIQPGYLVTVSDGFMIKRTIVTPLAFESSDIDADTVSGFAASGSTVHVWACGNIGCYTRHVISGEDGSWIADWSIPGSQEDEQNTFDLVYGTWVDSLQNDKDGDNTMYGQTIPVSPHFTIFPEWEWYDGLNWPDVATITITVDGKEDLCTATAESWGGFFNGGFPEGCDVRIYDSVHMTDGTTTLQHTVRPLSISEWNTNADTLTGWAYRGAHVVVWPHGYDYAAVATIAGSDGSWTADFAAIPFNLDYGMSGRAMIYDIDGNATAVDWQISMPTMQTWLEWNTVYGYGWNFGDVVTLTVGDVQLIQPTDGTSVFFDVGKVGHDIVPGDLIQMTNGQILKELLVPPLVIMDYDLGANTISGTYDPSLAFDISVEGNPPNDVILIDNSWIAYFTELLPNRWGDANQIDTDNDTVLATIRTPNPTFYVVPDEEKIYASEWSPGEMLYVKVNGSDVTSQLVPDLGSPYGPEVMFDLTGVVDLNVGDTVSLTDGQSNKELVVALVQITGYDFETHTISGIADPGELFIGVNGVDIWITVGDDGNWSVSSLDYDPGEWGSAIIWDSDGDQTRDIFMIPYPPP